MAVIGSSEVEIRGNTSRFQDDAESGVRGALGGIEGIAGNAGALAGIAGGVGLSAGLAEAMNIDAAQAKLKAQLNLSEEDAAKVGAAAGEIFSQNYGASMDEVNTAVGAVRSSIEGMASATSLELQNASINALNLANAFDIDVAEAASAAGIAVKTGLATSAENAFDLITASMNKVPAAMRGDFLEAANEYGVNLQGIGLTGEQAFGYLAVAAEGGAIALDKAGDSVKEFTLKATDGSTSTVAAYQSIGLNAGQMASDIVAGGDKSGAALQQIAGKLLEIKDPAVQAQTAFALFGTPLEDLGVTKVPQFLQAMSGASASLGDVSSATEDLDRNLNNTASNTIGTFTRGVQTAVVNAIGGVVIPKIMEFNNTLQSNSVASDATKVVVVGALVAMGVAAAINLTTMTASFIATAAQSAISAGTIAVSYAATAASAIASGATTAAIAGLYVASWVTMGVQSLIGAARIATAWVISLGPIAWVIAAIVGVAVVVVKNWDTIREKTTAAWNAVSGAVSGGVKSAIGFIKDLPAEAVRAFIDVHLLLINAGERIVAGLINGIKNKFGEVKNTLGDLTNKMTDWKGPEELDARLLTPAGESIMGSLVAGFRKGIPMVKDELNGLTGDIGAIRPGNSNGGSGNVNITVEVNAPGADEGTVTTMRNVVRNELAIVLGDVMTKARAGAA